MESVNLDAMLARFAEHRSPKKIAQVNNYDIRIVKIQGEFTWHQHADKPGTVINTGDAGGELTAEVEELT
jgi:hypothetical protein